jgi:Xaa-Pro aminopeptidase
LKPTETLVIIGDSQSDANLYYATGFLVGVTVVYLEIKGCKILLLNDLEYGRGKVEAKIDRVVSTTPYEERLRSAGEGIRLTSVLDLFLKEEGIRELTVPANFPFSRALRLQEKGYTLLLRDDPFFKERLIKRPEEISAIEDTQRHVEAAMELAVSMIAKSTIRGDSLHLDGTILTAETVRTAINKFLLDQQCQAYETIVAGGEQGVDPHMRGSGPLPANQTIILDIFPRSSTTRYWGDMTRTVVRGKASPAVRKMYQDVLDAQNLALSQIRDGVDGQDVHESVAALVKDRGNVNKDMDGKKAGFIHSTGHGVGLDIHEAPRLGRVKSRLLTNQVVTVEPGLYYPGTGAVRLEDLVVVQEDGCRNLNQFPKELEV